MVVSTFNLAIIILSTNYCCLLHVRGGFVKNLRRHHSFSRPFESFKSSLHHDMKMLEQSFWKSPDGLKVEVIYSSGVKNIKKEEELPWYKTFYSRLIHLISKSEEVQNSKPPLLFVHGSFHGAWCWSEYFFEYFNSLGFECYALSLRGTSSTGLPPDYRLPSIRVESHVYDLKFVIERMIREQPDRPAPIVIAHSFGGLILMKLLEDVAFHKNISAAAWLCSVPPSGNGPMTSRFIRSRFLDSLQIVWGFVFKAAATDLAICRKLFFDESVSEVDLRRYMRSFSADSRVGLDLVALGPVLPSVFADPVSGRASWLPVSEFDFNFKAEAKSKSIPGEQPVVAITSRDVSKSTETGTGTPILSPMADRTAPFPRLVLGAEMDFIVDFAGVQETAKFLGLDAPVILQGQPHDVMLGSRWREAATVLGSWLLSLEDDNDRLQKRRDDGAAGTA